MTALATDRDRERKSDSGISGARAMRAWMTTKTARSTTLIAIGTSVCADPQPWVSVPTMP